MGVTDKNIFMIDSKIRKVEIELLWGQFSILWEMHEDVNILSGINGSGKSSILDCIASAFLHKDPEQHLTDILKELKIHSNDGIVFHFEEFKQPVKKFKALAKKSDQGIFKEMLKYLEDAESSSEKKISSVKFNFLDKNGLAKFRHNVNIDVISTFDTAITFEEETFDENVRTDLDRELYFLQKKYLDFQLKLAKSFQELLKTSPQDIHSTLEDKYKSLNLFKSYINSSFYGKKLDENNNQISFISNSNSKKIDVYALSSGEKQMLLILLTFLLQENKASIVFLDEPEISLHFDWQKKLIKMMRSLNPNAQLIIATHSPAMVMDGWMDKVFNIEDIKKFSDNKNELSN